MQANARLLLHRAGRERRRRLFLAVLLLNLGDRVGGAFERRDNLLRFLSRVGLELFAAPLGQFRQESTFRNRG